MEPMSKPRCATNANMMERALRVIPGGVNSPVRAFTSVGGAPRFFHSGRGAYVVDVEGKEYVDLVGSWGPAILGHADPRVSTAVHQAVSRGLSFGASSRAEVELAELVVDRISEVEKVRLVTTGTEATMTAVRIARAATARPLIVKFAGHYHGHADGVLVDSGSGQATLSIPGSAGVTAANVAETLVLPYNNEAALAELFAARGSQIAAVITEAAAANMGVVPPKPGFTQFLLSIAHRYGSLVILDEVLTGFRAGPQGYWGIERDGVARSNSPDLFTFGKVIGGGLPMAAVGGRAELLDLLAPLGPVYQAGTLAGHPVSAAAGVAALQAADGEVYDRLSQVALKVGSMVSDALGKAGVSHRLQRAGTLLSVLFGNFPDAPQNYTDMLRQNTERYAVFFHSMLNSGISLPPSGFESWFVSAAFDSDVLDRMHEALPVAAKQVAEMQNNTD